jgi:WD40 repeat protein
MCAQCPDAPAQFVIASRDGRIGIVDVVSKTLLKTIDTGHSGELRLSISGDGKRLLSRTSSAGEAALYDLATGEKLKSFPVSISEDPEHPFLQTLALNALAHLPLSPTSTAPRCISSIPRPERCAGQNPSAPCE